MPVQVVKNDPFLTHGRGAADVPDAREDISRDPFLTAHGTRYGATRDLNSGNDFDLNTGKDEPQPQGELENRFIERLTGFLPTDYAFEGRTKKGLKQLVAGPFIAFAGMLLTWSILQTISEQFCIFITLVWGCLCIGSIARSRRLLLQMRVSPVVLGTLVLLAIVWGFAAGLRGYNLHFRQTIFSYSGMQQPASASTPGASVADAATIDFSSAQTKGGTSVDSSRAAGFKEADGHIYCVAPILDTNTASADMPRVNFWAIGLDCCEPFGYFTCGSSREIGAASGVVMLEGGFPCPTCNNDQFRLAVDKAASLYGVASAPGAVFLQWTSNVSGNKAGMMLSAVVFLVVSVLLAFFGFTVLGCIVWYYGLGLSEMEKLGRLPEERDNLGKYNY
mmetsp:Transcript_22238/g.40071  ORF Transcript_22238/g.40071 Transcript_22238/m.40071 type:complete len:391 (+) Transcript_22238:125-1297(+)|eukprot:CAMPEP_0197620880 /NCGR_PEP_ID=MMETSP1338-20131121/1592_1 /TAXON_ID=43686 ORGANISM="Pelagodinium beii, Strain RCC1491" /NCGR_SAMPLE_ID=MMETSP1338 /ASSEMBLY_ACC=CAM_ASM_000754 /LENGTH=390 /DNA_ID=CAMNT_0043190179 /DNA_START=125 /DNA_END=1297 /DNA_ORIENTATION=-